MITGSTAGAAIVVLLVVGFVGLWFGLIAFWIVKLIEVIRIPEQQYRAASTDKTTWILIVVLVQVIGAVIWQFSKRSEVLQAAGRVPPPPPGWYPDPTGGVRWWDGLRWTDYRQVPPP